MTNSVNYRDTEYENNGWRWGVSEEPTRREGGGWGGVGYVANNAEFWKVQIPGNLMSALHFRRAERQRRRPEMKNKK